MGARVFCLLELVDVWVRGGEEGGLSAGVPCTVVRLRCSRAMHASAKRGCLKHAPPTVMHDSHTRQSLLQTSRITLSPPMPPSLSHCLARSSCGKVIKTT